MDTNLLIEHGIALLTLTSLEIVLGIDNIVFIAIMTGRLPTEQRSRARRIGLAAAMVMRIALLFSLGLIMKLTKPLFTLLEHGVSGRDLILLIGGLFLIAKATFEIHEKTEGNHLKKTAVEKAVTFSQIIVQIMIVDMVFSLDSVITAVGMAKSIWVMVAAVVISVGVMLVSADSVSNFVEKHPTVKMLALSFLLLIGVMLLVEGLGKHVEKGYIYFAMGFSLVVEFLNQRMQKNAMKHAPAEDAPA